MFEIEFGADYADSYEIRTRPEDWDGAMTALSNTLAEFVDRRLIDHDDFVAAMEWVTGVVIDDVNVRHSQTFGYLGMSVTLTD